MEIKLTPAQNDDLTVTLRQARTAAGAVQDAAASAEAAFKAWKKAGNQVTDSVERIGNCASDAFYSWKEAGRTAKGGLNKLFYGTHIGTDLGSRISSGFKKIADAISKKVFP